MFMWIARDKNKDTCSGKVILGDIHVFMKKPTRKIPKGQEWLVKSGMNIEKTRWDSRGPKMKLPSDMYDDIKWEDEPVEVKFDIIHNQWDLDIFKYLNKIIDITEIYKNPMANDATGSALCNDIYNIIKELQNKLIIKK